jgi:hypothetical protein
MAKARCPGCGAGMKAKRRFCGECGQRNPLFAPKDVPAVKAAGTVLVKSAAPATVTEIRRAQLRREIYAEPDPGRRELFAGQLMDLLRGGAA